MNDAISEEENRGPTQREIEDIVAENENIEQKLTWLAPVTIKRIKKILDKTLESKTYASKGEFYIKLAAHDLESAMLQIEAYSENEDSKWHEACRQAINEIYRNLYIRKYGKSIVISRNPFRQDKF